MSRFEFDEAAEAIFLGNEELRFWKAYERNAENGFGCDQPNDPITKAQIQSMPGYYGPGQD